MDLTRSHPIGNKESQFGELSDIGRSLLERLYGSKDKYLSADETELDKWVIAYDTHAGDDRILMLLANRMGIDSSLEGDPDLTTTMYYMFLEIIDNHLSTPNGSIASVIRRHRLYDTGDYRTRTIKVISANSSRPEGYSTATY